MRLIYIHRWTINHHHFVPCSSLGFQRTRTIHCASKLQVKDLEQFIHECEAFMMDNGHVYGDKFDLVLEEFRAQFEEL